MIELMLVIFGTLSIVLAVCRLADMSAAATLMIAALLIVVVSVPILIIIYVFEVGL